jgi:PAS domain S-box-containing protein
MSPELFEINDLKIKEAFESFAIVSYTDKTGKITYASDLFCKISGYSREELIGSNHSLLKSGRHPEVFYEEIWKTISSGTLWSGIVCNKTKDGRLYWVDSMIFPIFSNKKIIGYGSVRVDVTDTLKLKTELESSQQYSDLLMANITEGIVIQKANSEIVEMNDQAGHHLGLTREQMLGLDSFDPNWGAINEDGTPCPGEQHPSSVAMAIKSNVKNRVMGVTVPEQGVKWLNINSTYYIDKLTGEERTVTSFNDVTEVKNQEFLMAQTAQLSALGEIAASIAHEINNPLTIIKMASTKMQREFSKGIYSPDKMNANLDFIVDAIDRLAKIVRGLKNSSRMGNDDPFQFVDCKYLLDDLIALSQNKVENHNIEFIINFLDEDCRVECRPHQINQILINLVNNAVDALENQSHSIIRVYYEIEDGHVNFIVEDNGPGVPIEKHKMIFQSLFTTKTLGKGTGLGLSLAKRLAEENKGNLLLDQRADVTRFILSLPRQK